ncbi:MAG: hypothetical protein V1775_06735 [Bacteroidota bacterium]
MDSIIYLETTEDSNSFTNLSFFSKLLPELANHYSKNTTKPVLSIEKLDWIEPSSLPNIVSLGLYLKNYHAEPIELKLDYNPKLLYYLEHVGFLKLIGMKSQTNNEALEIFNYEDKYIGGFSSYNIKEIRKEHKIRCYQPILEYSMIDSIPKKEKYRDKLIEKLESYILPDQFYTILQDKELTRENIYNTFERLAEPISNGILHSKSPTTVMVQTTKYRTKISISDAGIGFENSLTEKNIKLDFIEDLKLRNIYVKSLHDFYIIQQILFYSMCKVREGLFDFIVDVITINNGTVRIHYNSTQIILTTAYIDDISNLGEIRKEVLNNLMLTKTNSLDTENSLYGKCNEAILILGRKIQNNFKSNLSISPLRLYNINFKGVHIEIDLI